MISLRFLRLGLLAAIGLSVSGLLAAAERAKITLLSTTDLHGHIFPIDYYKNEESQDGIAKVATLIKAERKADPELLLVDCGDTIQGTPLEYYHNRKDNTPPDPMMLAMNALGYDALTIGNHEYNFGRAVLEKARSEANFPWLSGNTYKAGTDETIYAPYIVKEMHGVKVGLVGLTTPGIPYWENPENFAGLEFRQTVAEARKWVKVLREKEHVDVVVGAFHMGLETNLATGRISDIGAIPGENAVIAIAKAVPEFDVIFMGHTHRDIPSMVINGVLLTQAHRWGTHLAKAEVFLEKLDSGRWTVTAKGAESIPVDESIAADPEILALTQSYHDQTQAWLGREIGVSEKALSAKKGYFKDTALMDLIQRVQLEAGKADVSFAANFNPDATVPAGPVTVRDIAGLYVYENTLNVLELTGAQIKAALEHAARFYLPYEEGKTPAELIDRSIPGYNFDMAAGVTYVIDLRRPIGDRIVDLKFKGEPLAPDRKLRVAINNYRRNGGGGYVMFKDAPLLDRSSTEIRDLIIDWVEKHRVIPGEPDNNWQLLP